MQSYRTDLHIPEADTIQYVDQIGVFVKAGGQSHRVLEANAMDILYQDGVCKLKQFCRKTASEAIASQYSPKGGRPIVHKFRVKEEKYPFEDVFVKKTDDLDMHGAL